jgi:NAD(P)H-flavin reductase
MLLIGGGTGIAPLLSILKHVIENGIERDMRLFWGVRGEADLYAQATLDALSRRTALSRASSGRGASFRYAPVLSRPAPVARTHGLVHEAALGLEDLDDEVYAAGPPATIAALQRSTQRGASSNGNTSTPSTTRLTRSSASE